MTPFELIIRRLDELDETWTLAVRSGLEMEDYKLLVGQIKALDIIRQDIKDIEKRFIED